MKVHAAEHKDYCKSQVVHWDGEKKIAWCRECGAVMEEQEIEDYEIPGGGPDVVEEVPGGPPP